MTRDVWIRIFLVLHVLGAITGLGANLTYGPILAMGNKAGAAQRAFALKAVSWVDGHLANPAYMAQLVTGLTLVVLLKLDLFGTGWLVTALILYAGVLVFSIAAFAPVFRRQIALAERIASGQGGDETEYAALARRSTANGVGVTIAVVVIVVLMVWKPALW
jgi:hypothetical protein